MQYTAEYTEIAIIAAATIRVRDRPPQLTNTINNAIALNTTDTFRNSPSKVISELIDSPIRSGSTP
jgi:hypothetical protein